MQDACNLLSVHTFFCKHPTLSKCYPNMILIVVKATDNRMSGKNSDLGKSLRCIRELGLIDHKNPNVVTVVTHAGSIQKQNDKEWIKALDEIKSNVSRIVFDCFKVFTPVVLIENNPNDCALKRHDDYTRLRNGELQPKNLYEVCADVLTRNKDNLGLITLNSIFVIPSGRKRVVTEGHEIKAKSPQQSAVDDKMMMLVKRLEIDGRGVRDPIYCNILQYVEEEKLTAEEEKELMKIAGVLSQLRGVDPTNFGSNSIHIIEFILDNEISPTGRNMLKQKFQISMETTDKISESGRLVGQGYNIFTGKSLATQVMECKIDTKYGIAMPACAKLEKTQQSRSIMEVFEDETSYANSRLKSLNLNLAVKPGIFEIDCRAGYNKKNDSSSSSSSSEYSFLFEQRLFELKLGNYKDCLDHGMTFTKDFESAVQKLPITYDKSDPSCVSKFEKFFNRFGHFLVSSAYGGGSVEVKCSREAVESMKTSLAEVKACLAATLAGLNLFAAKFSGDRDTFEDKNSKALLERSTLSWDGGDAALQTNETIGDRESFQKWKNSLILNPTMLTSELTLEPISTAVECINGEKEQAVKDALEDLLGSEIKMLEKEATQDQVTKETEEETTRKRSVIDAIIDSNCFPSGSVVKVQSQDGEIKKTKMANLDVGDKVMAWDKKHNRTVFTKVIMFAHLAPDAMAVEYLKMTLEDGNQITLSGNHLLMVGKHKKAILARKVKPGDILFSVDENREISPKKVLAVEKVIEQGIYCPFTLCGNVIVDNVLASCYASVEDHVLLKGLVKISAQSMAHLGLMPMRALHKLRSKWLRKIPNGQTIHPYLQWLCKLNHPCMRN